VKHKAGIYAVTITDTKTGAWRLNRPVVSEKCTACGICAKFCPPQIIKIEDRAIIDYEYCKGCGICDSVCPFKAIAMVEEEA
jgi:2-oxoacid:acceptor oxidoreductase delta subunit (pyruvate/2-ketoisovalerate family)